VHFEKINKEHGFLMNSRRHTCLGAETHGVS